MAALALGARRGIELPISAQMAAVLDGGRTSLFVVHSDNAESTVTEIEVTTGGASGSLIQVVPSLTADLKPGMQVVTEGNERLKTGQRVELLNVPAETAPAAQ